MKNLQNQTEMYNEWLRENELKSWDDPVEYPLPDEPIDFEDPHFLP